MPTGGFSLNIQNSETIKRILEKICNLRLTVFIKSQSFGTVVVKGVASRLETISSDDGRVSKCLKVSQLSQEAMGYLSVAETVEFEFVMLSSMLVAKSTIISFYDHEVSLLLPKELQNLERRKGIRHRTTKNNIAFLTTKLWQDDKNPTNAPIVFHHFQQIGKMMQLVDISLEGCCVMSRQPSLSEYITPQAVDEFGFLHLPMTIPQHITFKVQWIKKITGDVNEKKINKNFPAQTIFLFGCQFLDLKEETRNRIGEFINTMIEATAI